MEKVLTGIHVVAVGRKYDAFVPADMEISQLTSIIANGVAELTDGKYESSGLEMLSLMEPESLLNPALTLNDYQVKDGMQLYLI